MTGRVVGAASAQGARPLVRVAPGTVLPREAVAQLERLGALREVAHDDGVRRGVLEVLDAAATALREAGGLRSEQLREAEPQALELAVRIAERILHGAIEREPQRLAALVREVRSSMPGERGVRLVAGPRACAVLQGLGVAAQLEDLVLEEAPQAEAWSLVMVGSAGRLEFGLEAQLRAVARALGVAAPG